MNILIDVMSGDNAPLAAVAGALDAAAENGELSVVMIGSESVIRETAESLGRADELARVEIVHTSEVITMEDPALSVVRSKSGSSMSVGLRMLADGKGDAFVSAGNTGALHAGSSLIVRRIRGIQRSAIATVLPFAKPILLIDSGANIDSEPSYLRQFAMMGTIYMRRVFGIQSPEVGLLNNGAERTKGTKTLVRTYGLLEEDENINFIGNVEGKDVPYGPCDVLVCDGFDGNVLLKLSEGLGMYMFSRLKDCFNASLLTKASALVMKNTLRGLKSSFDASEYGGAPILGLCKPVIKAHGSSDEKAYKNAVLRAADFASTGVAVDIAKWVDAERAEKEAKAAETAAEQQAPAPDATEITEDKPQDGA